MCKNVDVGIARHWISTTVDGIFEWSAGWIAFTSRPSIFESTITESKVCFYHFYSQNPSISWIFIHRRSGSPLARTPSPRRRSHLHPHHDVGFSDTVSNVVEIVKEERGHRGYRPNGRHPRGTNSLELYCTNFKLIKIIRNT